MFGEGFYTITIGEVVGLVVSIVGIWFVVKQLNETRLASQMEGAIALSEIANQFEKANREFINLINSSEWKKLDGMEARRLLQNNGNELGDKFLQMVNVYETVGGLVFSGAFDKKVASRTFGYFLPRRWQLTKKVTMAIRQELNNPSINENWEWLSNEFDKMSK